jgi:hypothetical protein
MRWPMGGRGQGLGPRRCGVIWRALLFSTAAGCHSLSADLATSFLYHEPLGALCVEQFCAFFLALSPLLFAVSDPRLTC